MKKFMFAMFAFSLVFLSPVFLRAAENDSIKAVYAAPCEAENDNGAWCVVLEAMEPSFVFKKEDGKMVTTSTSTQTREIRVVNNADLKKWDVVLRDIVMANYDIAGKKEIKKVETVSFHNFTKITQVAKLFANKDGDSLVVSEVVEETVQLSVLIITCLISFLFSMILLEVRMWFKNAAFAFAVAAFAVTVAAFAVTVAVLFVAVLFVAVLGAVDEDTPPKKYRISAVLYTLLFALSIFILAGLPVAMIVLAGGTAILFFGWLISRKKQKAAA